MINRQKYLPIGTIVKLKKSIIGSENYWCIISYIHINPNNKQVYDYAGVMCPAGYLSPNTNFVFNHEDITEIIKLGYMDDSYKYINDNLKKITNKKSKDELYKIIMNSVGGKNE